MSRPVYELRVVVGFEETNLLGNVYFVHPLRWQGRCREMFLREHAPDVLPELADGLVLVTTRASCEYFAEMRVFDEIVIRMRLAELGPSRLTMTFEYRRVENGEELVARGEQQIACMRRQAGGLTAVSVPAALRDALQAFA